MRNTFLYLVFTTTLIWMSGCGGNQNSTDTANNTSGSPQSMVADEPKDDGEGVGRFRDITLAAIDPAMAERGRVTFEAKCMACHKTTDQKVVGPGLKGVTQKRKPAWIMNMITNPVEMTQKDPTAKELLAEHLTQMTFQDVSDEQAKEILEYLRQNDAGGAEQASK